MYNVCVCVLQADAAIGHVMDAAGATRKTNAKPVSMHIYTHFTLEGYESASCSVTNNSTDTS